MPSRFEAAHAFTEHWEGGLTDQPADPGGLTNHGISLRWVQDLTRQAREECLRLHRACDGCSFRGTARCTYSDLDMNADGDVDADDIRACTREQAAAHWDEVEAPLHGAQRYVLDSGRYDALEKLGMLHISAARKANAPSGICPGALAGYAAFTLVECPHRPGTLLAALDGLYLAPWVRGGLSALRLLRHAEAALARRGVGLVQYSSPASRPCHALYRRIGAQATETIWHKKLEPAAQACKEAQTWP